MDGLCYVFDILLDTYSETLFGIFLFSILIGMIGTLVWIITFTKGNVEHVHVKRILDFENCSEFHDLKQVYTQAFAINICLTNGTIEIKHHSSNAYVLLYPQWDKCTHEKLAKGIEDSIKFLL